MMPVTSNQSLQDQGGRGRGPGAGWPTQAAWGQGDLHPPAKGKLQQTYFFPAEKPEASFWRLRNLFSPFSFGLVFTRRKKKTQINSKSQTRTSQTPGEDLQARTRGAEQPASSEKGRPEPLRGAGPQTVP